MTRIIRPFSAFAAFLLAFAIISAPARGEADRAFFDGKTITYIVSTKPGGGYDTYARLIARYLEKHLPGTSVVVRNVPGGGNIIGVNTLYAAEPDGLTIGTFNSGIMYAQMLRREGIKFDLRLLSWIGKAASDFRVLVVGEQTGIVSVDDLRASTEPLLFATSGVGSASFHDTLLLAHVLGIEVKMVPGFSGTEGEMSIIRGEMTGQIGSYSSLRGFVENGFGRMIARIGGDEILGDAVPSAHDLAPDESGRALLDLIAARMANSRLTAAPPGVPAERLAVLREAYQNALEDPELLAEAQKIQIPIAPAYGEEVAAQIDTALSPSPDIVAMLAEIIDVPVPTAEIAGTLAAVSDGGKKVSVEGETQSFKISGSRTTVTIDGADADRGALVVGMTCAITYTPGGGNEATVIACER